MDKKVKQVCTCKNCGNESEMIITCSLPDKEHVHEEKAAEPAEPQQAQQMKGLGVCTHCGNEADMWVDI